MNKKTLLFSTILTNYENIREKIETELAVAPPSDLSLNLISEKCKVLGYSWREFLFIGENLRLATTTQYDPIFYASLLTFLTPCNDHKIYRLADLACSNAFVGRGNQAEKLLSHALITVKEFGHNVGDINNVRTLAAIAKSYARMGQPDRAIAVVTEISLPNTDATDYEDIIDALTTAGACYVKLGQDDSAENALSSAFDIASIVLTPYIYEGPEYEGTIWNLAELCLNCIELGFNEYANRSLHEIAKLEKELGYVDLGILIQMATLYSKLDYKDKTCEILVQILEVHGLDDSVQLEEAALSYAEIGLFERALNVIKREDDIGYAARNYASVAEKYYGQKMSSHAVDLICRARGMTETIESRCWILAFIAEKFSEIQHFNLAIETCSMISDKSCYVRGLLSISSNYVEAKAFNDAHKILSEVFNEFLNGLDNEELVSDAFAIYQNIPLNERDTELLPRAIEIVEKIDELWRSCEAIEVIGRKYAELGVELLEDEQVQLTKIINKHFPWALDVKLGSEKLSFSEIIW